MARDSALERLNRGEIVSPVTPDENISQRIRRIKGGEKKKFNVGDVGQLFLVLLIGFLGIIIFLTIFNSSPGLISNLEGSSDSLLNTIFTLIPIIILLPIVLAILPLFRGTSYLGERDDEDEELEELEDDEEEDDEEEE